MYIQYCRSIIFLLLIISNLFVCILPSCIHFLKSLIYYFVHNDSICIYILVIEINYMCTFPAYNDVTWRLPAHVVPGTLRQTDVSSGRPGNTTRSVGGTWLFNRQMKKITAVTISHVLLMFKSGGVNCIFKFVFYSKLTAKILLRCVGCHDLIMRLVFFVKNVKTFKQRTQGRYNIKGILILIYITNIKYEIEQCN